MPMLSFRISDDLAARVDAKAEGNRSAWIKRAIEDALDGRARSAGEPFSSDRVEQFRRAELLRSARNRT